MKIFVYIQSPIKWATFFLLIISFLTIPTAKAISTLLEFKNDLDSSVYFKIMAIVDPESINIGGQFMLNIKIELSEGWHIYSLDAKGAEGESLATKITIQSNSFIPHGLWKEPTPVIGWDGALERVVKTHAQIVEFRRWYRAAELLDPGVHEIKGVIVFRACNNKTCNLPKEILFKTNIKLLGG